MVTKSQDRHDVESWIHSVQKALNEQPQFPVMFSEAAFNAFNDEPEASSSHASSLQFPVLQQADLDRVAHVSSSPLRAVRELDSPLPDDSTII